MVCGKVAIGGGLPVNKFGDQILAIGFTVPGAGFARCVDVGVAGGRQASVEVASAVEARFDAQQIKDRSVQLFDGLLRSIDGRSAAVRRTVRAGGTGIVR